MMPDSLATLVSALRESCVLDSAETEDLEILSDRFREPESLVAELRRRGAVTPYQVERILAGEGKGLVLGQYVLLEPIGQGGMGQVFKARHQRMKRLVAVKVIRKDLAIAPEDIRRFTKEIEAAAQLMHPNIVMAFDANEIDGTLFFVMEHVEGTDLAKLMKQNGTLSVAQACDYIRQAACGLAHAHERGLVHRDIKPSNLMLTTTNVVKLLDLGLARLQEAASNPGGQLTGTGAIMGTPDFMSPEQGRDSRNVDIRSDLYSLGCTLYCLLTRQVPFPGGTFTEKLLKHNMEEPLPVHELRPDVPAEVAAIVRKLLAKDPDDRYQTPAALAAALAPFAANHSLAESAPDSKTFSAPVSAGQPVARPTSRDTAPWKPPQRRRPALVVPVAIAVVLGLGGLLALLLTRDKPRQESPPSIVAERPPEAAPANQEVNPAPSPTVPTDVKPTPPVETKPANLPAEVSPSLPPVAPRPVEPAPRSPAPEKPVPSAPRLLLGVVVRFDRPLQASTLHTALSTNGEWAVVSYDGRTHLWQIPAQRREDRASETIATSFPATSVAVSSTGSRVLMGRPADDPNTPAGKVAPVLPFVSAWDPRISRHEQLNRGHKDAVSAVALSTRGFFALSGGTDRAVYHWDLSRLNKKTLLGNHSDRVTCVAYAADGIPGLPSHGISGDRDGKVILWDLDNGKKAAALAGHRSLVTSVAFSPDGRLALSAGFDGIIQLYDVTTGDCLRSFTGHDGAVKCVAFAPDGKHFVTGGEDCTLRLWDIAERENVHCFDEHNVAVLSVAVSADGKHAVFICADQTIRRCELPH